MTLDRLSGDLQGVSHTHLSYGNRSGLLQTKLSANTPTPTLQMRVVSYREVYNFYDYGFPWIPIIYFLSSLHYNQIRSLNNV